MSKKLSTERGAKKSKNMLKTQRIALIILVLSVIVLCVGMFFVGRILSNIPIEFIDPNDDTVYYIKKSDGVYVMFDADGNRCAVTDDGDFITAYGTVVQVDGKSGEYYVDNGRELIFPQLFHDAYNAAGFSQYPDDKIIERLDVENIHGSYSFVREKLDNFILEGHPDVKYTQEAFVSLIMSCSYPLSILKLESPKTLHDGSVDWSEYGLAEEMRENTVTDEDGNTTTEEYKYFPTKATITAKNGDTYTLYIGDATISGDSFYARYAPKGEVFVLASTGIANYLTQSIESVISPSIVHTMTSTDYVHVRDFILYNSIDHKEIERLLGEQFKDFDRETADAETVKAYDELYAELFDKYSEKACHFTFQDLEERENSIYATLPFISHLDYSKGYYINSSSVTMMLQDLYEPEFIRTEKLAPTDGELDAFGLLTPENVISFTYFYNDENGEEQQVYNKVYVSAQNPDGSYYAYSDMYDMIVCIGESTMGFLSWDEFDWYDPSFMQYNINHLNGLVIESGNTNVNFTLDKSQTLDGGFFPITEDTFDDGKNNSYQIKLDKDKYVLYSKDAAMNPAYRQGYLIMGIPFSVGAAEYDNCLFTEVQEADLDEDGQKESYIYYYYNVTMNEGKYCLYATVIAVNAQGEQISDAENIVSEPAYSTDCFITGGFSQYMFLLPKDSAAGAQLSELYPEDKRLGQWIDADIFITADGRYILVNPADGMWSKVASVANPVYIGDKDTGKMSTNAVVYEKNGLSETVYTNTGDTLSYNADTNKFQLYSKTTQTRRDAEKDEVAPAIWCSGDFYVSLTGDLLVLDPISGDAGLFEFSTSKFLASVYADGEELDYTYTVTSDLGSSQKKHATYNFQQFYTGLLFGSFEGMCPLSEEEMQQLRALDDFSGADERCLMKMTMSIEDVKGNTVYPVYRFYKFSERRAYVTIEVLDSPDGESDSNKAYGGFFVLSSYVEKLVSDAGKVVSGTPVDANSKY